MTLMRLLALALLIPAIELAVSAQTTTLQLAAAAYSHDSFQLSPTTPTAARSIVVDTSSVFSIYLLAASRTLNVSLTAPDGTRFSVGDPTTNTFESGFTPIDTVNTKPGASYVISISSPISGTWTLDVRETALLSGPLDIVTTTFMNNNILLVLVGGGDSFPLATDVRLALVAFDGRNKLSGFSIKAQLFRPFDPTFKPVNVEFRDDGSGADETAGDGIYETFVNPGQLGSYQVQVTAIGTASTGSFRRSTATELRIVPHNAQIQGFNDRGIDDDFDGLYDRIGITPSATLLKAGTYVVSVRLRASNGNEMQRGVTRTFPIGTASAEVIFSAADILHDLGVDGPYSVAEVRYFEVVNDDLVPADIRYDLGSTTAYTLKDFQQAHLRLDGKGKATGRDTNGNSLFDFLDVDIGIIAEFDAQYSYSTSLTDSDGRELGFAAGSVFLNSGANTLSLNFPGLPIGHGRVNGPYFVSNLLIFGAGDSLISTRAFVTPPFAASQFEGGPIRGDLDGDGDVDRDDLNILLKALNKPASGINDPRDLDGDGKITVLDARILATLFTRPGGAIK